MKTKPLVALSLALAGASVSADDWKWTPEAVVDQVAVGNVTLSPDGQQVVFTRSRWRPESAKPGPAYVNLWRVPFDGGEPQRLTSADAEDSRPRFSPDGRLLTFLSKRGGESPKTRIWALPSAGGEPYALSDDKTEVLAYEWAPDAKSIAYVAADPKPEAREKAEKAGRDETVVDQQLPPRRLHVLDVASGKAAKLDSLGELSAWDFDWAPDAKALVASVTERNRTDDSYMWKSVVVLPLAGPRRELAPVVGKVGELAWSRDGRSIAWLGGVDASDPQAGSVFVADARGGAAKNLTGERAVTSQHVAWRADGRLVVTSAVSTGTTVELIDAAAGGRDTLVAAGLLALAGPPSFSSDGTRYALAASTARHPADVFAGQAPGAVAKGGKPSAPAAPKRLVHSNPQLDALPRGAQDVVRYRAKDGLEIEGLLVKPVGYSAGTRYPLIAIAHGGPESHYLDGWNSGYASPAQLLAERGYAVFFPNYRGSTGRGVAYAKADHKDLGGKELTDVLDGIDSLAAQGLVDPRRVGITGGSYGGYFTALGVTRHSDRFAAGVELFGITNWESFLGQSDIPAENALVHWALWCYDEPALCRDRSPLGHIGKARTPTLILQGADDLRVPKPQSDELYAALVWKKVSVEYVVYPREGHGFRERAHRLDACQRLVAWFDKYLRASP